MTKPELFDVIAAWWPAARKVAAKDPATAATATGYGGVDGLVKKLYQVLDTKSLAFAQSFILNNLQQATSNLNSFFGAALTVPGVSTALPLAVNAAPDLSASQQAAFESAQATLPMSNPYIEPLPGGVRSGSTTTAGGGGVSRIPVAGSQGTAYKMPQVVSGVPEIAPLPPKPHTVAAKAAPTTIDDMAIDPAFDNGTMQASGSTAPVAASLGDDIVRVITGAAGAYASGGNVGDVILGGVGGYVSPGQGGGDTTSLPQPANGGDNSQLLNQLLSILNSIPGGQVPAAVIQGAQNFLGNGTQPSGGSNLPAVTGDLASILAGGGNLITAPEVGYRMKAPRGYVIVTLQGQKVAMYKPLAIKMGLWHRTPKPPITASEWRALKRAERVKNKAKKVAQTADFHVYNEARAAKTCRTRK